MRRWKSLSRIMRRECRRYNPDALISPKFWPPLHHRLVESPTTTPNWSGPAEIWMDLTNRPNITDDRAGVLRQSVGNPPEPGHVRSARCSAKTIGRSLPRTHPLRSVGPPRADRVCAGGGDVAHFCSNLYYLNRRDGRRSRCSSRPKARRPSLCLGIPKTARTPMPQDCF